MARIIRFHVSLAPPGIAKAGVRMESLIKSHEALGQYSWGCGSPERVEIAGFVTPAQARSTSVRKKLDSRFRGNDRHKLIFTKATLSATV
jgi:hypothetical protein